MWYEISKALCLVLVLEGVLPFLAPGRWRRTLSLLTALDDRAIRAIGFVSMLIGAGLLSFIS